MKAKAKPSNDRSRQDNLDRPALSKLILYAVDVARLVLAVEQVGEYERTALFKEKARVYMED